MGSFTRASTAIPPRARVSGRLRAALARAIASSNRFVAEVARKVLVGWHTAHRVLIVATARGCPRRNRPQCWTPTRRGGRSVRWIGAEAGWVRSDPWMTSREEATPDIGSRLRNNDRRCLLRWAYFLARVVLIAELVLAIASASSSISCATCSGGPLRSTDRSTSFLPEFLTVTVL